MQEISFTGTEELAALQRDLTRAAAVAPKQARAVVKKGLHNIKDDSRRRISTSQYFRRVAQTITYESHETPTGGWGEVGPEHGRPQATLAFVAEVGALDTPPRPFMGPAADTEQPKFEQAMQDLAVKALGLE